MVSPPTEKTLTLHANGSSAVVGVSQSGNKTIAYDEDGTKLWRVGCNGDIQRSISRAGSGSWEGTSVTAGE